MHIEGNAYGFNVNCCIEWILLDIVSANYRATGSLLGLTVVVLMPTLGAHFEPSVFSILDAQSSVSVSMCLLRMCDIKNHKDSIKMTNCPAIIINTYVLHFHP